MTATRRTFVATLVSGFTLAAGPLNAAAIVTDASGLVAGEVSIPVGDGIIPGFRARPANRIHAPVVLVVHEIFGVHEFIKDVCRRFAKLGYYAIAPLLYARYGDPGRYDADHLKDLISEIVSKVPDAEVMGDLDATVAFAGRDGADAEALGITGFCWGGRIVWLYAAHASALRAGVAWYGPLRGQASPLRPKTVIDLAGEIRAPVLGLYGGKDLGIPPADVEAMREALKAAGNAHSRIDVFDDASHGFFADYRQSYNEKDAAIAWPRAVAWFAEYGVK